MGTDVCERNGSLGNPSHPLLTSKAHQSPLCFDPIRVGASLQVHDQRSAVTEEEELANQVWLDGKAPPQQGSDLEPEARHMIQSQRQYYDEVHVIKEQVCLHSLHL